jgi:tetratricopeptide (TPR) repeat protein
VTAAIERVLAGPTANDYFAAASYYHETGKDLNKALEWINKATEGDNPMFWQVRRKALILADLNRKPEAIEAAKKSMELAEAANNADYVRMNKKSIEEWSKK